MLSDYSHFDLLDKIRIVVCNINHKCIDGDGALLTVSEEYFFINSADGSKTCR